MLAIFPRNGDSAVTAATMYHQPATLRELVRAGSDLNLQNEVNYLSMKFYPWGSKSVCELSVRLGHVVFSLGFVAQHNIKSAVMKNIYETAMILI